MRRQLHCIAVAAAALGACHHGAAPGAAPTPSENELVDPKGTI